MSEIKKILIANVKDLIRYATNGIFDVNVMSRKASGNKEEIVAGFQFDKTVKLNDIISRFVPGKTLFKALKEIKPDNEFQNKFDKIFDKHENKNIVPPKPLIDKGLDRIDVIITVSKEDGAKVEDIEIYSNISDNISTIKDSRFKALLSINDTVSGKPTDVQDQNPKNIATKIIKDGLGFYIKSVKELGIKQDQMVKKLERGKPDPRREVKQYQKILNEKNDMIIDGLKNIEEVRNKINLDIEKEKSYSDKLEKEKEKIEDKDGLSLKENIIDSHKYNVSELEHVEDNIRYLLDYIKANKYDMPTEEMREKEDKGGYPVGTRLNGKGQVVYTYFYKS